MGSPSAGRQGESPGENAEPTDRALAGTWESVLNATFKHRTRAVLGRAGLPQPRAEIVHAAMTEADIEAARERVGTPEVWVKAPGDSHGRGIKWIPAGEKAAPAARQAMRAVGAHLASLV